MAQTATVAPDQHIEITSDFHRIRSIGFSGGFIDGPKIDLANGLNCLIGNRGTGKTTALEFVRYVLDEFPDEPALRRHVEGLVAQNLGGGRIELVEVQGPHHRLEPRAPGGVEAGGPAFRCRDARYGVAVRHHLHPDG